MSRSSPTSASMAVGLAAAFVQFLLPLGSPALAQDDLLDLLRLDTATVEWSRALSVRTADLEPITDANPATAVSVPASVDVPLDVVYGFDGQTVAPEQLVVRLPAAGATESAVGRIEILASTLSATAGFRSLREEPLQATGKPQRSASVG